MSGDTMNSFMDSYPSTTENGDHRALHSERHDEPGSQSGSDEGSIAPYADSSRNEAEYDDDSDALTSQTLNADGTPKRPMNAFMIFARKRRPQVSAENQAMRTGEISKILSKEWAVMLPGQKQYYLDRAKQLKETFNSKYPDYVYRRRPNNSRKKSKRRLDMAGPVDQGSTPEAGEDYGNAVCDYDAHPEGDDRQYEGGANVVHSSRIQHDYIGPAAQARSNPYPYVTPDSPYRHESSHDPRMPFISQQGERLTSDHSATSHRLHADMYGYVSSAQSQQTQIYPADPGETQERWEPRVASGRSGWITTPDRPAPTSTQRFASTAPTGWTGGVTSASASGPTAPPSNSTTPGNFSFPTLTSPFYPAQAHLQGYQAGTTSSSHPDSPVRYDSPAGHGQASASGREYDAQNFTPPSAVAPGSPYPNEAVMYQQRIASISRGHALASYSHSPHPASSGAGAPQGY